jgi:mRNA-degrading endonuclease toxin of MazEF toxin-antitoxin module
VPAPPRLIVLPLSTVLPQYGYPLSWEVPSTWGLPAPSWVLVDHVRSLPSARLRDPFIQAERLELLDILGALGALLGIQLLGASQLGL